jgi:NADPH-dependent glutamate synthase beta subunit-like oxidoreductase
MATSTDEMKANPSFRKFKDGESTWDRMNDKIMRGDTSHKCPVYVHRTPPCQANCPSGEDIRGWLNIVRGIEKPPKGMTWQDYAFYRLADAQPFPSVIGRICPAPCQTGCNRNDVDDHVGINSVEQYIGDQALKNKLAFKLPEKESGKKVAIIGGGPAGLSAAYQLRRKGHACTIFESHKLLGGMIRYGVPGYRTPREVLDGEIQRILDMGVEVKFNTKIGRDISMEQLEKDYDAVFVSIGAQSGNKLTIPGGNASNVIDGIAFLDAFNDGRLKVGTKRVVVIGGGDTAMDVVSVARRLGHHDGAELPAKIEEVIMGHTAHDAATAAKGQGAEVTLAYRRTRDEAPASEEEIEAAEEEGVNMIFCVAPVEVVLGDDGRAKALRVVEVEWVNKQMQVKEGSEFDIECDLIVPALGQGGDFTGMEELNNGRGLINADGFYQVTGKPGFFVAGDIIKPHIMTAAIGQGAKAARSIEQYLQGKEYAKVPRVDVRHFNLLNKLDEAELTPAPYSPGETWGTDGAGFAVHNYENRAAQETVSSDELFLGHFKLVPRNIRQITKVSPDEVVGHFEERMIPLSEEQVVAEAKRCMSCGLCFECDNCVVYCPQDAVQRTPQKNATIGRYVYTDYSRCVGCHICADVCPTGYIQMGMAE